MSDPMSTSETRCPWCSAVLPDAAAEKCPSCGAQLTHTSGAEPSLPGVTAPVSYTHLTLPTILRV